MGCFWKEKKFVGKKVFCFGGFVVNWRLLVVFDETYACEK